MLGYERQRTVNDCGSYPLSYLVHRYAPACVFVVARVLQLQRVRGLAHCHVHVLLCRLTALAINVIVGQSAAVVDGIDVFLEGFRRVTGA